MLKSNKPVRCLPTMALVPENPHDHSVYLNGKYISNFVGIFSIIGLFLQNAP